MIKKIASALAMTFAALMAAPGAGNAGELQGPAAPLPKTGAPVERHVSATPHLGASFSHSSHDDGHEGGKNYIVISSGIARSKKIEEREGESGGEIRGESGGESGTRINPGVGFEHANPFFAKLGEGGIRTTYVGGAYYNSGEKTPVGYAGMALEGCSSLHAAFTVCAVLTAEAEISKHEGSIKAAPVIEPGVKVEYNPAEAFISVGYAPSLTAEPPVLTFRLGKEF